MNRFVSFAAPIMAATIALSQPAFAEDVKNSNTPVTNATITAPAQKRNAPFNSRNGINKSVKFVEAAAAGMSANYPVIVVWGGSQEAMKNAYVTAKKLNNQGMAIGIVLGPNRQTGEFQYDVEIEVYAKGGSVSYDRPMQYGRYRISEINADLKKYVEITQSHYFP